ncbi:hypothetical protein LPJ75_007314, partial [Coemansia sp. RSA 2598]
EDAAATHATTSADSSLTATLVTPSVDDYYGPRLKQGQQLLPVREPVSATTLVSSSNGGISSPKNKALPRPEAHDMDADDEADGNWRIRNPNRNRSHHQHSNNSNKNSFDSAKASSRNVVDFSQFSYGKNNHALYKPQGKASLHISVRTRDTHAKNDTFIARTAYQTSMASGNGHAGMPVMHSLPTALKPLNGPNSTGSNGIGNSSISRSRMLDLDAEQPAFSWADDVEDMPIPSLTADLHSASRGSPKHSAASPTAANNFGDEALSDELSWFTEDDHFQQSSGVFAMEL